jgi:hypothetical protein
LGVSKNVALYAAQQRNIFGQAFALAFLNNSIAFHSLKRAQTIAQSFTRKKVKSPKRKTK